MRWQRAAYLPLATLAVFGLATAVLLALSPLNETPDTYCGATVFESSCTAIAARRWRWIGWVLGVAVLLAVAAAVIWRKWTPRGRGRRPMTALRVTAAASMLVAVLLGLAGAAYLTIGKNSAVCGSTLSRIDEHGGYSSEHPRRCAPSYAASRANAWTLGLLGLAALVAGTVTEAVDRRDRGGQDGVNIG